MQRDSTLKISDRLKLAEVKLAEDVSTWVLAHRKDDRSWQWIANRLAEETGVVVSRELLRQTYADHAESGVA